MKNTIFSLIGLLLLCSLLNCSRNEANNIPPENSIRFYSTPELFDLTSGWASAFCTINPEVKINVIKTAGPSLAENLNMGGNLSFMSGHYDSAIYVNSLWNIVVGRDVIVPVFNSRNPLMNEISRQGISPAEFAQIINNPKMTNWGTLLKTGLNAPVNLYVTEDESINSGMSRFLNVDQINMNGATVVDVKDLIAAVQEDPFSIGICKIPYLFDTGNQSLLENVRILPLDKNENGKIDYKEDIYDDLNSFSRGVWIGKYPRALSNNIYSLSAARPANKNEIAFLKWIVTDGQVLLDNHGYSDLEPAERLANVKLMDAYEIGTPISYADVLPKNPLFSNIFFLAALTLIAIILVLTTLGIINRDNINIGSPDKVFVPTVAFNEDIVESHPGLYYDKTHTWAFMDKDGMVKIGVDDFLQHITGPLTRVKMKFPGDKIKKGKQILSIIQDGKQLDIYAPVSGTIKEQNKILLKNTSVINSSPYTDGWVYKIEPTNWLKEIQFLILGNKYKEWLKSEFSRLKDFLTDSLRPETVEYAHVLQDGGELKDRILEDLGPEVWEDFQTNFIDVSS